MVVRIGTAGWSIPRSAAEAFAGEGSHLERYGRVFRCAEINSTFYRPPRATTWARWAGSVPDHFRFAVKAPKVITHEAGLRVAEARLQNFLDDARRLGDRLGPLLFQLPPRLAFDRAGAEDFLLLLRESFGGPVALEPRHASWFTSDAEDVLRRYQVARVAADPARVPEACHPGGWAGLVYYRLHGSPRTYYSAYESDFLATLAESIRGTPGRPEVWVVFDNTASGAAAHNALALGAAIDWKR